MYEIYAGSTCIFDDTSLQQDLKLIDPILTMEANAAGTLTFTMLPQNAGNSSLHLMRIVVSVYKNGDLIWQGRVSEERVDFMNRRHIVCEGELAYLNDTTQPPKGYGAINVKTYLERIIAVHNAKTASQGRFTVGTVTVSGVMPNEAQYRCTNYETTMECISDKLVGVFGGYISVRHDGDVRYIDYLKEPITTNAQVIQFGRNLLDFSKSFDCTTLCTVVVPLGKELDESPIADISAYVDVSTVNGGSVYVSSAEAIENYGWIEKVVHWDDIERPSDLLTKARTYLSETQFEQMQIEVSVMDLSVLNVVADAIRLMERVRVVSSPHGLDRYFPVAKMTIPLDKPEEAVYELGTTVKQTLTSTARKQNSDVLARMAKLPTPSSILASAQDNASQLIRSATNGYVTLVQRDGRTQEILISDTPDYETSGARVWRWNVNGLGYSSNGYNGNYNLAMTMDGAIVADVITTGHLNADRIYGGTLTLGGSANGNGLFVLNDSSGQPSIYMSNNGMGTVSNGSYMKLNVNGQITGGKYSGGSYSMNEILNENNYSQHGVFDANAALYDSVNDRTLYGFRLKTDLLSIVTPRLAVTSSMADDAASEFTVQNANIPYVQAVTWNPQTGTLSSVTSGYLHVVNGLIVGW